MTDRPDKPYTSWIDYAVDYAHDSMRSTFGEETAKRSVGPAYAELGELRRRLEATQQALSQYGKHDPGCPTIADDESDQVLADYQECVCGLREAVRFEEGEVAKRAADLRKLVLAARELADAVCEYPSLSGAVDDALVPFERIK